MSLVLIHRRPRVTRLFARLKALLVLRIDVLYTVGRVVVRGFLNRRRVQAACNCWVGGSGTCRRRARVAPRRGAGGDPVVQRSHTLPHVGDPTDPYTQKPVKKKNQIINNNDNNDTRWNSASRRVCCVT